MPGSDCGQDASPEPLWNGISGIKPFVDLKMIDCVVAMRGRSKDRTKQNAGGTEIHRVIQPPLTAGGTRALASFETPGRSIAAGLPPHHNARERQFCPGSCRGP